MQTLTGIGVLVIVIDALDECDNREKILQILSEEEIPKNIRFIVTARPEDDIMTSLQGRLHVLAQDINEAARNTISGDIKSYILYRISKVRIQLQDTDIELLVSQADGLFQWAATACNHICDRKAGANPQERLKLILSEGTSLDALYGAILEDRLSSIDSELLAVKSVLAKVLAAAEPVSIAVLKALCIDDREKEAVDNVLPFLGSVLTIYGADVICPIHASFRDYLTKPSHSHNYFIDIRQGHQELALASFRTMKKQLQFNICQIKWSYLPNSTLTQEQLSHISQALYYSCRFWPDHLQKVTIDSNMEAQVSYFMKSQLLFWLEVLSVKNAINVAIPAMKCLVNQKVCSPLPNHAILTQ